MTVLKRTELEQFLAMYPTNPLAQRALTALRSGARIQSSTGPLPLAHVRRIYTRRAEWNAMNHFGIEGFADLLSLLNTETGPSVAIHPVSANDEVFSIFTDPSLSRLIGILVTHGKPITPEQDPGVE